MGKETVQKAKHLLLFKRKVGNLYLYIFVARNIFILEKLNSVICGPHKQGHSHKLAYFQKWTDSTNLYFSGSQISVLISC